MGLDSLEIIKNSLRRHIEPFESLQKNLKPMIDNINWAIYHLHPADQETLIKLIKVVTGFECLMSDFKYTLEGINALLGSDAEAPKEPEEPELWDPNWDGRKV